MTADKSTPWPARDLREPMWAGNTIDTGLFYQAITNHHVLPEDADEEPTQSAVPGTEAVVVDSADKLLQLGQEMLGDYASQVQTLEEQAKALEGQVAVQQLHIQSLQRQLAVAAEVTARRPGLRRVSWSKYGRLPTGRSYGWLVQRYMPWWSCDEWFTILPDGGEAGFDELVTVRANRTRWEDA